MTTAVSGCAVGILLAVSVISNDMGEMADFRDYLSNQAAALEGYAGERPDNLYFIDTSLVSYRPVPFKETVPENPSNIAFWGGWIGHYPLSQIQYAYYGLEGLHYAAFLRDNVFYVSDGKNIGFELFNDIMESMYADYGYKFHLVDGFEDAGGGEYGVYRFY